MYKEMKCKKCRKTVFSENKVKEFVDAHGKPFNSDQEECDTVIEASNVYLSTDTLPLWLLSQIQAEDWTKGRILCPNCRSKIGVFNYISGQKCGCSRNELGPIYFVKSKVDLIRDSATAKS